MSLQERTLVVRNFDPEKVTKNLLLELFIQSGPVRNVVLKPDHAFVEFEDAESVGYSKALIDGVSLHGKNLWLEPKINHFSNFKYCTLLQDYISHAKRQEVVQQQQQQMIMNTNMVPPHPQYQMPAPQGPPVSAFAPQPLLHPNMSAFALPNPVDTPVLYPNQWGSNFGPQTLFEPVNDHGLGAVRHETQPPRNHPYQNNNNFNGRSNKHHSNQSSNNQGSYRNNRHPNNHNNQNYRKKNNQNNRHR